MCEKKELTFSIFILYALAEKWQSHRLLYIKY